MIRHIIFDFFGTLVGYDSEKFFDDENSDSFRYLKSHGYDIPYEEFKNNWINEFVFLENEARRSLDEYTMEFFGVNYFQKYMPRILEKKELLHFLDIYLHEWNRWTVYYPGIREFLGDLSEKYSLSIITNTHSAALIHENLDNMEIRRFFREILTSVEFGYRKPSPKIFQHLMTLLEDDPHSAVFVGDTYREDYEGAVGAGMRCLLIDPGRKSPVPESDRIDSLFDIEKIIEESRI